MKTSGILFCIVLTLFIASSCSSPYKVRTKFAEKPLPELKSIGLVTTAVLPIMQPVIPLIDAAAFNKKTNNIADQIMDEQNKRVGFYRERAANQLNKYFKADVVFGESLKSHPRYSELKSKCDFPAGLRMKGDNFPLVLIPEGDVYPFPFEKNKYAEFFKKPESYKPMAKQLCEILGTDAVAVCYTQLYVLGVMAFGINGSLSLNTFVYLFDKEGDMIASGSLITKPSNVKGKEIADYTFKLDEFDSSSEMIINQTAAQYMTGGNKK